MKSLLLNIVLLLIAALAVGCQDTNAIESETEPARGKMENKKNSENKKATFAGGCFWCTESDFEKVDGVIEVVSGYTGGEEEDPSYEKVSSGGTGHLEAVQILYDPGRVTYKTLLDIFWKHVDPTDPGGQFVDRGPQYRTAIFYHDDEQRRLAEFR